ncbi:hypothetical protein NAC44_17695 [Allorhizobium sp. BGMRC 0089]|uniref:hypothetical protein n=1 Tax=Allorhizobium sonneratiae TaxID=2934936 RepID=UPI00203340CE|nr:hypothetical protein [Allorhizobium sonneratiae]MCM2294163.1 hypothetical protein [Allorhizobium sonneratiae]
MPRLTIIGSITDPGKDNRPNEDRAVWNDSCAFVLDGATGLGERQFMPGHGSDAEWIAAFAAERLAADMTAEADAATVIRRISEDARTAFTAIAGEQPRYTWPVAALAGLRMRGKNLDFIGLGDSVAYLLHDDGRAETHIALPWAFEREQAAAREHITRVGGIGQSGIAASDAQTLTDLRRSRERQNTEDGSVWTLGLVPEVADHLCIKEIAITGGATAIICSDGLADLVSLYHAYGEAELIRRAATAGLGALVSELRRFEREIDPDGLRFPRYKQSDDTTALLLRVEQ